MNNQESTKPFKNRYCPSCLGAVNPDNGSHWHYCEYEAGYIGWKNPIQPLTDLEMLNKKLETTRTELKNIRKKGRILMKLIKEAEEKHTLNKSKGI